MSRSAGEALRDRPTRSISRSSGYAHRAGCWAHLARSSHASRRLERALRLVRTWDIAGRWLHPWLSLGSSAVALARSAESRRDDYSTEDRMRESRTLAVRTRILSRRLR